MSQGGVSLDIRIFPMAAVLSAAIFFSGCAFSDHYGKDTDGVNSAANVQQDDNESFFLNWQGEKVTPGTAAENNCVFMGCSDSGIWQNFLVDIIAESTASVTVCSEDKVMHISESGTGSTALVRIKEKKDDGVEYGERLVSPVEVYSIYNEEEKQLEYYMSDILLNKVPSSGGDGSVNVPVEYSDYRVSSKAAATFPYQKYFSSYGDFEDYYDMYHKTLGLDSLKKAMRKLDDDGGFNTNVVFLYADRSVGDAKYRFLRAVVTDKKLTIYIQRDCSGNMSGVSKWQLTCTVPGEYLSDVAPDAVHWVIYDDVSQG